MLAPTYTPTHSHAAHTSAALFPLPGLLIEKNVLTVLEFVSEDFLTHARENECKHTLPSAYHRHITAFCHVM